MLALCTKAFRGWPEEVLSGSPTGEHEPVTPKVLVEQMAYAIANPSECGAVRYAKDWPGAKTLVKDIGRRVVRVQRPSVYLDATNEDWPEVAEVPLEMPDILVETYGSVEAAQAEIDAEVRRIEREARQRLESEGRSFLGARRVLRTPHTRRASGWEDFGSRNPTFSAGGDLEAAKGAIRARREFNAAYDEALAKWMAGDRSAVFPHGTWWMRVHHKVRCHPPP